MEEIETLRNQLYADDKCADDNLSSMANNIVLSIREASGTISPEALNTIFGDIKDLDTRITDPLRDLFPNEMAEANNLPKDVDPVRPQVIDQNQQTKVDQINERLRSFTIHKKECNENKKKTQEKFDKIDEEIAAIKERMKKQDKIINDYAKCVKLI